LARWLLWVKKENQISDEENSSDEFEESNGRDIK